MIDCVTMILLVLTGDGYGRFSDGCVAAGRIDLGKWPFRHVGNRARFFQKGSFAEPVG